MLQVNLTPAAATTTTTLALKYEHGIYINLYSNNIINATGKPKKARPLNSSERKLNKVIGFRSLS